MTQDEIQKMVGHKLDATIQRGLMDPIPHGMVPATIAPSYHDDLNACHAAEERLAEMGKGAMYAGWLRQWCIDAEDCEDDLTPRPYEYVIAHLSARTKAELILMAVQEGETG